MGHDPSADGSVSAPMGRNGDHRHHTADTASRRSKLTVLRAAATATGLAQNAMASPAASNMSRSLAPSPMAITRSAPTLACAAHLRSQDALAARSTISPVRRPVRCPSATSNSLATA